MKRLNNLVTELHAAAPLDGETAIRNPREGWVYFACDEGGTLTLNGETLLTRTWQGRGETMRYLPAGEFHLSAEGKANGVVARAVPEMAYTKFQYNPFIREYGTYDWDYLAEHVLPHVNMIVGSGVEEHRPLVAEWKRYGGRWIVERGLPTDRDTPHDPDEAFRQWIDTPGLMDPLYNGVLIDEFFSGDRAGYPAFTEVIRRIAADDRFAGKQVYPYVGSHFPDRDDWGRRDPDDDSTNSMHFYRAILESGFRIARERYMQERHEEAVAEQHIGEKMTGTMAEWAEKLPGVASRMLCVLGYMDMGFQLDIHPEADIKVYRDMQFGALANAEPYDGLYGVTGWTSGYADDETIRWTARLYRHYGIEGNTEPLSDRYGYTYRNDHIWNPDFRHDWEGWEFPVLNEKTCGVKHYSGFSILQGRWNYSSVGDTFLVMKRTAERANEFSQPLRNLKPGKLYAVKLITGDYRDLLFGISEEKRHGIRIGIDGGEVVPEKSFVAVRTQHPTVEHGPFNREHPYWMNYHRLLFRATGSEGRITLSDWENGEPAGPVGQEVALNFVQVQEYFEG